MTLGQFATTTTTTTITKPTTTTKINTTTKSIICLAILFVILLLPLNTHELSRDLCQGSEDDCAKSPEALSAGAVRKVMPRRAAKSKFKFHKIERMDEDNGGEEDDDNESEAVRNGEKLKQNKELNSAENDEDENDEDGGEENDDDDDGDDGDDDDNDDNNDNDNDDDDDNDNVNDDDDDNDDDNDGDNDDNDNDNEADEDEDEKPSLFSQILDLFTSDAANETATQSATEKAKLKQQSKEKDSQSKYPNIINWFHWLIDQTGDDAAKDKKKEKQKLIKSDIDWFTYLKRWPFNSIFPEESRAKQRTKTKQQEQQKPQQKTRDATARQQSKSDEYMELLIHSLPAFFGNVAQVKSGECHQQLELLHQQLRSHKLWTLQMLDATGKIGAGLLRGNINQFGDFDQCTQVSTSVKVPKAGKPMRVNGKYCLAQIEMKSTTTELKDALHLLHGRGLWHAHLKNPKHFVPRYSIANWGICLPHACSAHVVHTIIETSLRPYNDTGIQFHIDVRDEHCSTRRRKNFMKLISKDNNLALGIFVIGALGFACVLSSVWEHWDWISRKLLRLNNENSKSTGEETVNTDEEDRTEEVNDANDKNEISTIEEEEKEISPALHLRILNAFSPQRTWQSLVSLDGPDIEFPLIHLLKILATFMIYVNLKFIMAGHLPITNRDAFVGTINSYWSLAYRVPLLYSDLLLLLSGFLVAHKLSNEMETTCRLSFLRNVATKACRYVPSILAVLGFQTWILPHLGAGPLWNLLVGENARLCEDNMWRSALNVQNTADMEEMCSPLTVQLSLDMQLYFLGALVVWLYFTDPEAGFFLCGAFHAISVAARYSRTQRDHLAPSLFHGIHVSKFYRTANLIYASPITRATTYLLGIGAGLLFRSESGVFRIAPRFRRTGWVLAMLAIVWCFWSPASGIRSKYVYKSSDAAAYLAWSPLILGLGICWCILMAPWDKNMVQKYPNIARPVLLLSRIEIPLQLVTYVVVLWNTASVKEPQQFLISDLINLQEIAYIVVFAIIVAFLIDFPAQEIGRLILDFNFSDPLLPNTKDNPAENASNEESIDPKSDSPEPVDSIWPSESDPEDEKSSE